MVQQGSLAHQVPQAFKAQQERRAQPESLAHRVPQAYKAQQVFKEPPELQAYKEHKDQLEQPV